MAAFWGVGRSQTLSHSLSNVNLVIFKSDMKNRKLDERKQGGLEAAVSYGGAVLGVEARDGGAPVLRRQP